MTHALRVTTMAFAAAGMLVGCVSFQRTPGARYFVLRSLPEPQRSAAAAQPVEGFVAVLPVRIPGALERPQLVAWTAENELRLEEYLRWAEPLDRGATRTLAEDLASLLPSQRVVRSPWPSGATPRCRVAAELRVFGLQANGDVRLEASVSLLAPRDEQVLARRAFVASRAPASSGGRLEPGAQVEAMSVLLADLAKEVALAIEALSGEK